MPRDIAGLDELADNARVIAEIVGSHDEHRLRQRPGSDEWSVAEILGHVRAADAIWSWRILLTTVHDGAAVPDVDERALQIVMESGGSTLTEQATTFALGRAELVGALRHLSEESWAHTCRHERHGVLTMADLVAGLADHEREHIVQLRSVLASIRP
jgi:uncharacterized damage-inducible protein DinB